MSITVIPLDDHPDRDLLADIAQLDASNVEWKLAGSERARRRILKRDQVAGLPHGARRERVAATQAKTMVGLIAKADYALQEWRELQADMRWVRVNAEMAVCLEQAVATLQALETAPEPVIVVFEDD